MSDHETRVREALAEAFRDGIAAARAEATATERARCVAAVEKERPKQPWGAGLDRGPSLFVLDVCNRLDHIIAAIRGTEGA